MELNNNKNDNNKQVDFIFYKNKSPNVFKVRLMLLELGVSFEEHEVNILTKENYSNEFLKLNPNAKIPVLIDNTVLSKDNKPLVIFESNSILIYLAQKFSKFLPDVKVDPFGNSNVITWTIWQCANLGPSFGNFTFFRRYAPHANEYSLNRFYKETQRILKLLDERLSTVDYIAGNEVGYSIADMAIGGWLLFLNVAPQMFYAPKESYPNIHRWLELISQREAVKQINQLILEFFKNANPLALRALYTDDKDVINAGEPIGISNWKPLI